VIGHGDAILEARAQIRGGARNADRFQVLDDADAGDLACVVTAHAIGDGNHSAVGFHEIAIFVEVADAAGMDGGMTFDVEDTP
jgi:hypothetical protein